VTTPIQTIARGEGSRITDARRHVARSEAEWGELWHAHAGPELPLPPVDFGSRMVAAIFAGERPTPGYDVAIAATRRDGAALVLVVTERHPPAASLAARIIASPFHIVTVPRFDGDVRFEVGDATTLPAVRPAAAPRRRHEAAPSSTGLSPQVAAVLAYLAGPLSGALLLAIEQTSRFVRFHAFQALLGLGSLGVAAVFFLGLAFAMLFASSAAFWTMLWLAAITAIAWIVVWGTCLFQAYKGRLWKLPIAGAYAERWAGLTA
jgi:uncharacterized membrane protein